MASTGSMVSDELEKQIASAAPDEPQKKIASTAPDEPQKQIASTTPNEPRKQDALTDEVYRDLRAYRRSRIAAFFEIGVYCLIVGVFTFSGYDPVIPLSKFLTSPNIILPVFWLFFAIFFFLLTGGTPLVAFITTGMSTFARAGSISLSMGALRMDLRALDVAAGRADAPLDAVEVGFEEYLRRSRDAVEMSKRVIAHPSL